MQLTALSASLAWLAFTTASATLPVKLPLRWVDRRAYTTTVLTNGSPTTLELTTTTSDVWLACSRMASNLTDPQTCATKDCPAILSRSGVNVCASQTKASLSLQDDALLLEDFPVDIVLDKQNASTGLSNGSAEGLLGLGLRSALFGSMYPELLSNKTLLTSVSNFSLFLTDDVDGNGSFVLLGGSFEAEMDGFNSQALADRNLSTRFSLPLRVDSSAGSMGWDLSLTAVRFGQDQLLYPRVYQPSEAPGGDAEAIVSIGDSVVKMPQSVFTYFRQKYLTLGCVMSDNGTVCDRIVFESLPQITFYLTDKIFRLDPAAYALRTDSQALIAVSPSMSESRWILGAPFLRKFPAMFSLPARRIDLMCQFSATCDSRALGTMWSPQVIPTATSEVASSPTPSTMAPYMRLQYSPVVILAMGSSFGFIGIILASVSISKRWRHRNDPNVNDTGTVASDKDLEELALAAAEMSLSSESEHHDDAIFISIASPQARNTTTH